MKALKMLGTPFTALAGKVDHTLQQKILMSAARHGATALGAYLVTKGYLDMNHVAEFTGALMTLVATLSGSAQKVDEAK